MSSDNLSAVLFKPMDLRLVQRPIPDIKDNEVLLQMDCVGICGSDVHYWSSGQCGLSIVRSPMISGHEASGVVYQVGSKVTNLKKGDRVAVEPGVPCRICQLCKGGKYNLCRSMIFCACPPHNGNLTRFYPHAADFCHKIPDHMTMEEAALLEPLSVGLHGCRRGQVSFGSVVLILGGGPIGIVTLLCAKAMGASKILVTDMLQSRLNFAKELGATHTVLVTKDITEEELVGKIHQTLEDEPDVSLDCSGVEATVRMAILATKSGGVVVLIGKDKRNLHIPIADALQREVDIRGVYRYCNDYPLALAMVANGAINVLPLVSHHFDLEDTLEAFNTAKAGKGMKVMIHLQPRGTNNKSIQ